MNHVAFDCNVAVAEVDAVTADVGVGTVPAYIVNVVADYLKMASASVIVKTSAAAALHLEGLDANVIGAWAEVPAVSRGVIQTVNDRAPFVCGFERDPRAGSSTAAEVYQIPANLNKCRTKNKTDSVTGCSPGVNPPVRIGMPPRIELSE